MPFFWQMCAILWTPTVYGPVNSQKLAALAYGNIANFLKLAIHNHLASFRKLGNNIHAGVIILQQRTWRHIEFSTTAGREWQLLF
jgi:hypothetical protein